VLKEKIDADTATGVTPDIDALLKKYQEEAVAFEVTLRDSNSEDNLLAASSTMADVPSDANFEKNEVIATSTFRVAPDLDDLERDVQDAKLQQSMVKAAEVRYWLSLLPCFNIGRANNPSFLCRMISTPSSCPSTR
jgi:hypothetical protein